MKERTYRKALILVIKYNFHTRIVDILATSFMNQTLAVLGTKVGELVIQDKLDSCVDLDGKGGLLSQRWWCGD